jgi:H/ACA ribonucleoprotein complex subunit 4
LPGIVSIPQNLKKGDLVGIYSLKGEIVGLGNSLLDFEEFHSKKKGICFQIKRIVMKPNTYPKFWSTSDTESKPANPEDTSNDESIFT